MPGRLLKKIIVNDKNDFNKCIDIINKKQDLFVVVLKGEIPKDN